MTLLTIFYKKMKQRIKKRQSNLDEQVKVRRTMLNIIQKLQTHLMKTTLVLKLHPFLLKPSTPSLKTIDEAQYQLRSTAGHLLQMSSKWPLGAQETRINDMKVCSDLFKLFSLQSVIIAMANQEGQKVHCNKRMDIDEEYVGAFIGVRLAGLYRSCDEVTDSL